MKKIYAVLAIGLAGALMLSGCGKEEEPVEEPVAEQPAMVVTDTVTPQPEAVAETPAPVVDDEEPDTPPDGMCANQLTGEWIDASLKDQRPIAVMVDDERTALPHFGISTSDIMYEMVNSTMNEGVTRFMVMVKDWGSIKQLGSIRSTRPSDGIGLPATSSRDLNCTGQPSASPEMTPMIPLIQIFVFLFIMINPFLKLCLFLLA